MARLADHVARDLADVMLVRHRDPVRLPLLAGVDQGGHQHVSIEPFPVAAPVQIAADQFHRPAPVEFQETFVVVEMQGRLGHPLARRGGKDRGSERF